MTLHNSATEMSAWISLLEAMPIPAALVDAAGDIAAVNRWLDRQPGDRLVEYAAGAPGGLRIGVNDTRWRIRPLNDERSIFLATAERLDVGDHLLRKFFSASEALFVVYDQAGRVIESNSAWESLLGYASEEVFGMDSWTLLPEDDISTRDAVEEKLRTTGRAEPSFKMRTASGEYRLIQWALHFDFSVGRCFGVGRDVTEEQRRSAELKRRAYTDDLTGIANRARLVQRLESVLETDGRPAILYCDIDRFKVINDSLGHAAGDALLTGLAELLDRTLDAHHGTLVARLGGDEFVVLVDSSDSDRAIHIAGQILHGLKQPIVVDGRQIHVSMSIGIATAQPGLSTDRLLSHADTAVYAAKRRGRGTFVLFDEKLQNQVDRRFNVEAGLRSALRSGGIETFYQPLVDLDTGRICGAEALVRWRNARGEIVAPGGFLDVAEDAGLLPSIGESVVVDAFSTACQVTQFDPSFSIGVNTSQDELLTDGFSHYLSEMATNVGLSPDQVIVEIVESAAISTGQALPVLEELRSNGFRIALDDFGTGFSSLAHLRDLPIDMVKVDRSFVSSMNTDPIARALTESLVHLGSALELAVVMEGIETVEQEHSVRAIGGRVAQGYRYFKPMPQSDFLDLMLSTEVRRAA